MRRECRCSSAPPPAQCRINRSSPVLIIFDNKVVSAAVFAPARGAGGPLLHCTTATEPISLKELRRPGEGWLEQEEWVFMVWDDRHLGSVLRIKVLILR